MGFSYGPLVESAKFTIGSLKCDSKPRNHKEQILNHIDKVSNRTSNIESKMSCSACLTMNLTLSMKNLKEEFKIPGLYQQSNLVDGKLSWTSTTKGGAIWYNAERNSWIIGLLENIGTYAHRFIQIMLVNMTVHNKFQRMIGSIWLLWIMRQSVFLECPVLIQIISHFNAKEIRFKKKFSQ